MDAPTPAAGVRGCPFACAPTGGTAAPVGHRRATPRSPAPAVPDPVGLARGVLDVVRRRGKHFLPESLLVRLDGLRHPAPADPYFAAFLDCVLDKYDGRFHNRTYLALPLLETMLDDPTTGMDPDRLSAVLMSDVVRFELAATGADRPDDRTLRTRLRHARRFVELCSTDGAGGGEPTGAVARWLDATALPVSVLHDEYFFIRALQCHELTFIVLVADVRAATRAVRAGAPEAAEARLRHAIEVFARAALLFRIVATMRAATFHTFREFTQGASAIQSDQYKRFEAACGAPSRARLRSDAFAGVPVVRDEVLAGQDDLSRAVLDSRRPGATGWDGLGAAIAELEGAHQRWKAAHRGVAGRMLGTAAGSGYTEGVPYLDRCMDNRLFGDLSAA
ncbi:tryptophan 2,3-dioxygenase family protein [Pseudonocardia lacus]|uniref:tryptophan 2,3-dioxygenase family protein n=1 Tax=Pseudonocardia lacus TaxID=2835865 RepID=UPI001BDC9038|nr:tryptophan 2,3-dioxygenase family protein [Pseudonocardia lacus]